VERLLDTVIIVFLYIFNDKLNKTIALYFLSVTQLFHVDDTIFVVACVLRHQVLEQKLQNIIDGLIDIIANELQVVSNE